MSNTPALSFPPKPHDASSVSPPAIARPTDPARVVCDIADSHPFTTTGHPPTPILAAFGAGRLHECRVRVDCDLERALGENSGALVRSRRWLRDESPKPNDAATDLIFEFGPRLLLHIERGNVSGYAEQPDDAVRLALEFASKYKVPPVPSGGSFQLIKIQRDNIETETVTLEPDTILSDETLDLHYGNGLAAWHRDYARQLPECARGLSIFEGAPGTGKTSYLRHLMGVLKESHRFYFVPPARTSVLTRPDFIEFWAGERRRHSDRKFVIILEDAEEAIMRRGSDNSAHVSAILNLSDGLLADFLRLHIICTMNCATADIDPALLRPGRLLCHRVFGRLDRPNAARLAKSLGRTLPAASDYSLAEIFAGHAPEEASRPRIGFAA